MGVVNMLDNSVWTEQDVVAFTEATVRSQFSDDERFILLVKMQAMQMDRYVPTQVEMEEVMRYEALAYEAQQAGVQMRADMALKAQAMAYEQALARLAQPVPPATVVTTIETGKQVEVPNPALQIDAAERAAAQAVIDGVSPAALELVTLRGPAVPAQIPEEVV